jgi:hypothetical protein
MKSLQPVCPQGGGCNVTCASFCQSASCISSFLFSSYIVHINNTLLALTPDAKAFLDTFKANWKSTSYEELATKSKLVYVFVCTY